MDGILQKRLLDLALAVDEDPDVLLLKEKEAALKDDPALLSLVEEKDKALSGYMLARMDYGEDSEEAKAAQKKLHQTKMNLDLQPKSHEYTEIYSRLSLRYRYVDDILFGLFRQKKKCEGRHD